MSGWQDIASAPRDCVTPIILWCACADVAGDGWHKIGTLMPGQPDWLKEYDTDASYWAHENGGYFTHWMPLPTAPESASA